MEYRSPALMLCNIERNRTAFLSLRKNLLVIYGPLIYTSPYVMLLMRANPLREQVGGGWARGNEPLGECHLGPKKSRFPGPNPLSLAQVMGLPASKALRTGPYQSVVHGSFMYMSFCIPYSVFSTGTWWVLCTWVSGPTPSNGPPSLRVHW